MTRTRADVARAALQVLTYEGSDALTSRPRRRTRRLLQDHALHALAGTRGPDLLAIERSATCRITSAPAICAPTSSVNLAGVLPRGVITDMWLDLILTGIAQWASVEEMPERSAHKINSSGQGQMRAMLGELFNAPPNSRRPCQCSPAWWPVRRSCSVPYRTTKSSKRQST